MNSWSRHLFRSLLPYSMSRRTRLIVTVALALTIGLLWQCEKKEEQPPPTPATQAPVASQPAPSTASAPPAPAPESRSGDSSCCEVVANPELKGRLGRLVVTFPEGSNAGSTRIDVFRPGDTKSTAGAFGGYTFDLLPGTYDVEISKKRLAGVPIQSGHDTRVKVGLLRINAGGSTRVDVLDATGQASLTGGFGNQQIGLPIGAFQVKVAGQAESVKIEDGKVTEF